MAKLDLESSGESNGYSDSFEIEEDIDIDPLDSSTESGTKSAVISQLKKTLTDNNKVTNGTQPASGANRTQTKTKKTTSAELILKNVSGRNNKNADSINYDKGSVDLGRTIRSPMRLSADREEADGSHGSISRTNAERPKAKFKRAAQNVYTMQSVVNAAKSFNDSLEVRDVVYSEWLARKTGQVCEEKNSKVVARRMEEEKRRKKEIEMAQRSAKAVKQWSASKELDLQKTRKQKQQKLKKVKEEAKEIEEKKQAAEIASKKWRQEKTRELISQHRETKKKQLNEEKLKEEEAAEKAQSASQAFVAWSKTKDEVIKMEKKKQRERKRQLELSKTEQEQQRRDDSKRAFEAWKGKKGEKLSSTKTLYTYKDDAKKKVHERAWCPARSIKHTYPKAKLNTADPSKAKKTQNPRTTSSLMSYSSASFESVDEDSETDSSIVDEERSIGRTDSCSCKGVRKTIQVCCQTLEYWCTCDHDV